MENTTENGPRYNHDSKKPDNKARVRVRVILNWLSFLAISSLFLTACGGGGGESKSVQDQVDKATLQPRPSETAPPPTPTPDPIPADLGEKAPAVCGVLGSGVDSTLFGALDDYNGEDTLEGDDLFAFEDEKGNPQAHYVWEFSAPGTDSPAKLGKMVCIGQNGASKEEVRQFLADLLYRRSHPFEP